jgi:hypothetical protein
MQLLHPGTGSSTDDGEGHVESKQAGRAEKNSGTSGLDPRWPSNSRDATRPETQISKVREVCLMVRFHEQILQENFQRLQDLAEPSPVKAAMLYRIKNVQRDEELARHLGFVFPEEHQIQEVSQ